MTAYSQRVYQRNRLAVIAAAAGRCQIRLAGCTTVATTADHVIPVSAGGSNDTWNLRAACAHCNYRLGAEITNTLRRSRQIGRRSRRW